MNNAIALLLFVGCVSGGDFGPKIGMINWAGLAWNLLLKVMVVVVVLHRGKGWFRQDRGTDFAGGAGYGWRAFTVRDRAWGRVFAF